MNCTREQKEPMAGLLLEMLSKLFQVDNIKDTRHLCKRFRIDGIKAMSRE